MLLNRMQTKLILIFTFIVSLLAGCTKDSPSDVQKEEFLKNFGGAYNNEAVDLLYFDGSYYVLGNSPDENENYSIYFAKTDEFGNLEWEKKFSIEDKSSQANQFIKLDKQEGFGIIGSVISDQNSKFSDICFLVVDDQGNELKHVIYSEPLSQYGKFITELATGEFAIVGTQADNLTTNANTCLFYKMDDKGELMRTSKKGGGTNVVTVTGICNPNNKEYIYVTGSTNGEPEINFILPDGTYDGWSKVAIDGEINGIWSSADNQLFICGSYYSGPNGNKDAMVAKISYDIESTNFQIKWEESFGFSGNDWGVSLYLNSSNNLTITGVTQDTKLNTNNIYLIEMDTTSTLLRSNIYGGTGNESGVKSIETPDNKILTLSTSLFGSNSMITLMKQGWE